jgi:prophage antirepressor-like protein
MLDLFKFKDHEIRFVEGKPAANDVAQVLGYSDPATTIYKKVKAKNKSVSKMVTLDGKLRDVMVLEEAGIYQLIFGCKLPIAEEFQDWVFEEVLPSIRKTGSYSVQTPQLPSEQKALNVAKAINGIQQLLSDDNPRLAQYLIDHAISDIMPSSTPVLTGSQLKGVVEIAEELGYKVDTSNRGQLGKFVKARCAEYLLSEDRLVNGTSRPVACYPSTQPEVIEAITDFFNR